MVNEPKPKADFDSIAEKFAELGLNPRQAVAVCAQFIGSVIGQLVVGDLIDREEGDAKLDEAMEDMRRTYYKHVEKPNGPRLIK